MLGWGVRESVLAGQVGVSRQYKITVLICCEYNDTHANVQRLYFVMSYNSNWV